MTYHFEYRNSLGALVLVSVNPNNNYSMQTSDPVTEYMVFEDFRRVIGIPVPVHIIGSYQAAMHDFVEEIGGKWIGTPLERGEVESVPDRMY